MSLAVDRPQGTGATTSGLDTGVASELAGPSHNSAPSIPPARQEASSRCYGGLGTSSFATNRTGVRGGVAGDDDCHVDGYGVPRSGDAPSRRGGVAWGGTVVFVKRGVGTARIDGEWPGDDAALPRRREALREEGGTRARHQPGAEVERAGTATTMSVAVRSAPPRRGDTSSRPGAGKRRGVGCGEDRDCRMMFVARLPRWWLRRLPLGPPPRDEMGGRRP